MQQIRLFDLFLTGALFFVSGAFFTAAMEGGSRWQPTDTRFAVSAIASAIFGSIQLRRIYRRLNESSAFVGNHDPRPNDR